MIARVNFSAREMPVSWVPRPDGAATNMTIGEHLRQYQHQIRSTTIIPLTEIMVSSSFSRLVMLVTLNLNSGLNWFGGSNGLRGSGGCCSSYPPSLPLLSLSLPLSGRAAPLHGLVPSVYVLDALSLSLAVSSRHKYSSARKSVFERAVDTPTRRISPEASAVTPPKTW